MLLITVHVLSALISLVSAFPGVHIARDNAVHSSYDYVVVGGGTSGLVVANRLSENPNTTVLVLEAGPLLSGDAKKEILLPAFLRQGFGRKYWWEITSLSNSQLNGVQRTFRREGRDYDEWAEYIGDASWGWDGLLKYFKKSETFTPPSEELQKEYGIKWDPSAHGTNGPVQSSYPPFIFPQIKYYIAALKGLGVPMPKDGANANAVGGFWIPNSLDPVSRTRSYSKTAHHDTANPRSNYHLATERTATKIVFGKGKRAIAVEFATGLDAPVLKVKARKEVILAAGAVLSPGLLQLSGIGDSKLLKGLQIPVVVDLLGVGNNYQDHAALGVQYQSSSHSSRPGVFANTSQPSQSAA